jgi:hypothetical protein
MPRRGLSRLIAIGAFCAGVVSAVPADAQLNTQHLKGVIGLKGGSQPPPHVYVIAPLIYTYRTDTVRDSDGTRLPIDSRVTVQAYAFGVSVVTNKKILGARYGFEVLFPVFVNNLLQATEIEVDPGGGLSDSMFSPISLGWTFKQADVLAAYNIFAPTGDFTPGSIDNTGFGMWGHEVQMGTTVYFNAARQYHAATVASFDFQTKKKDTDTKVGNTMILEGGVGADFLKGGLTTGLVYYGSFKLTEDELGGFLVNVSPAKSRVFALGPEVSLAIAKGGTLYGMLKVNYQWEVYARTTTQGDTFTLAFSLPVKPIKLPK